MSAPDPVQAGLDAYDAALARGATRAEAAHADFATREAAYGHADAAERAELMVAIDDAAFRAGLLLSGIEAAVGLRDRALSDGSTPTDRLREALDALTGSAS